MSGLTKSHFFRKPVLIFLIAFASIGALLLLAIRAAGVQFSIEAENAMLSSPGLKVADSSASDGFHVNFSDNPGGAGFYIVGKDIVDPDGNKFYPIGANAALKLFDFPYVFEGNNGGANEHIQAIKDWNWNTIRANLVCDNDSGMPTMDELVEGLKREVPKLTSQKIVVILECHDLTGQNPQLGSAKELKLREFWDRMAVEFRDDPYVWFSVFNEPWNTSPDAAYSNIHKFYIDRIRSAGAENIITVNAPVWGQGLEFLAETNLGTDIASSRCNVLFEWHAYGAFKGHQGSYSEFDTAINQVHAKNLALVVGEYGIALPQEHGNAGPWAWNVSGFNHMSQLGPQKDVGLLWWNATGDTVYFALYALKANRGGFWDGGAGSNLTGPGQTFWSVSQSAQHSLGAFSGSLAQSNCQSAM